MAKMGFTMGAVVGGKVWAKTTSKVTTNKHGVAVLKK